LALQGTLDTFSLLDVLRLLATTTKTGRLRIEGDRGRGDVWFRDGSVVDADADHAVDGASTDEVVFELLRFRGGSFTFESDTRTPNAEHPDAVDDLLRRAQALLSEWAELEAVVPSPQHRIRLSTELPSDEITIDAERWRSVVAVASGRSVGDLARTLGFSELRVSRAVRDLVELGVAEVAGPHQGAEPERPAEVARGDRPRPGAGGSRPRGVPPSREPSRDVGHPETQEPAVAAAGPRAGWRRPERGAPRRGDRTAAPAAPPPGNGEGGSAGATGMAPPPPTEPADDAPSASTPPPGEARLTSNAEPTPRPGPRRRPPAPDEPSLSTPPRRPRVAPPPPVPPAVPPAERDMPAGPVGRPLAGRPPFAGREPRPPEILDTGQVPPVPSSALPDDLHWAADDAPQPTGPVTSPFSGLSSLGPMRPAEGDVAPHLAAMSPEAQTAVQAAIGNAAASTGGPGPSAGDDVAQRGRLINFLSSIR
jgi:hypothetical protein